MTVAPLISSMGIAVGPKGVSFGSSGAKCDCGCGPENPCASCLGIQPCAVVSMSPGSICDAESPFATGLVPDCFLDYSVSFAGTVGFLDGCAWYWSDNCNTGFTRLREDGITVTYDPSTLVYTVAAFFVGENFSPDPNTTDFAWEYVGTTTGLTCVDGILTGSLTIEGINLGGEIGWDCTGQTALVTFGTPGSAICNGEDCWSQIFSCIGSSPTTTYVTCTDALSIGVNTLSYSTYSCVYLGGPTHAIPDGATIIPLSDITIGTGTCSTCVSPCYIQARLCACDTISTGGVDQGDLVDAWFACDSVPAGGAFFISGIGCCYLQTISFVGPNPGYPDGSNTLGGTLYAGDDPDITPYTYCAACMEVIGCVFGTGDYESWDDFIAGGVPMYGFSQTYTVTFHMKVTPNTATDCSGTDSPSVCDNDYSIVVSANSGAACDWSNGIEVVCGDTGTVAITYVSGQWKTTISGGAGGVYDGSSSMTGCTPAGTYPDIDYCENLGIGGARVQITGITVS